MVLLRRSAPLSLVVFNNEGRFCYRAGIATCNVTGMVASLKGQYDGVAEAWSLTEH